MKKLLLFVLTVGIATLSSAQLDSTAFKVMPDDGSGNPKYISVPTPDGSNLRMTGSWTIEAWIYIPTSAIPYQMFICETYSPGSTGGFLLRINSSGQIMAYQLQSGSSSVNVLSADFVDIGEWNHIAATYDESTELLQVFHNGVLSNTMSCTIPTSNTNDYLYIGARGDDQHIWQTVDIDEVRIWNVAKSESELAAAMSDCLTGNESDLMAYYDMETTNNTVSDITGNGNNGTVINHTSDVHVDGVFECSVDPSGIEESMNQTLTLYPNPASSTLTIESNSKINRVIIYNTIGEVILTETSSTFSVTELENGVYILRIEGDDFVGTKRFIKE